MLWYTLVLIAVICEALESIIDKVLVVNKESKIDAVIASFFRNLGFFVFVCIAWVLWIFGPLEFFVTPAIVLLWVIWIVNSLIYDYVLRYTKLSQLTGITFIFPILLLIFDIFVFEESFSLIQIIAILCVFFGAFQMSTGHSSDGKKSMLWVKIWGLMFAKFLIYAIAYAIFKHYHISEGLSEINFYFSVWVFVMLSYGVVIMMTWKFQMLLSAASQDGLLPKTLLAKFFDFLSGIFFLQAVVLASLTSVKALHSLLPLVILLFSFIIQKCWVSLKETFGIGKWIGVLCIVVGSGVLIWVSG